MSDQPDAPATEEADAPRQLTLAFGIEVEPQQPESRRRWFDRLRFQGLNCYWEIYESLLATPPAWETRFWADHPNRKSEWYKKALYIAWAAAPDSARQPRKLEDFAAGIGISRQTIWNWRRGNPELDEAVRELAVMPLELAVRDVDYICLTRARDPDATIQDIRLFYDRYNQVQQRRGSNDPQVNQLLQVIFNNLDFSKLSEETIERLADGENPIAALADSLAGGT